MYHLPVWPPCLRNDPGPIRHWPGSSCWVMWCGSLSRETLPFSVSIWCVWGWGGNNPKLGLSRVSLPSEKFNREVLLMVLQGPLRKVWALKRTAALGVCLLWTRQAWSLAQENAIPHPLPELTHRHCIPGWVLRHASPVPGWGPEWGGGGRGGAGCRCQPGNVCWLASGILKLGNWELPAVVHEVTSAHRHSGTAPQSK